MEYINIEKKYTKADLIKIANIIKCGGVAVLPTDTVYGIASDAMNNKAVMKIYELKGRDFSNPMNILVSNMEMIKKVTKKISKIEADIIKEFFPGAITVIFEKNDIISDTITAGLKTVGIRMPENKFLLELIEIIGNPIVATSCNLSGEPAIIDGNSAIEKFEDKVECIVDCKKTKIGVASTIVKVENQDVKVLREGPISKSQILKSLNRKDR